jgi:glucuronoarabinoxylan endo-1,4-beta-xylanase
LGGHLYGWNGSSYPLAAEKGKEVWMTEYLLNDRQETGKMDINWVDDGFLFARSINDCMLANMSAWVHYSLKRYYGIYGDGPVWLLQIMSSLNVDMSSRNMQSMCQDNQSALHSLDDKTGTLSSSAYLAR